MTCVFDQAKALCQLRSTEGDVRVAPDQGDCRSNCRNIAYTDGDIAQVRAKVTDLRALLDDFLAPPPRHSCTRAELERLNGLVRAHERRGGQGEDRQHLVVGPRNRPPARRDPRCS